MITNSLPDDVAAEHRGVAIEAAAISKRHRGGKAALDRVALSIRPGRLAATVGPSGAGKTTLLAAPAGITPVDAGTVSADLGASSSATYWALLVAFAVAFAGTAYLAVRRRVAHETR